MNKDSRLPHPLIANPQVLKFWATRQKCIMCKYHFDKPILLPTSEPKRGALRPNINPEVPIHLSQTHGMTHDYIHNAIFLSIYGIEPTFSRLYGKDRVFRLKGGNK